MKEFAGGNFERLREDAAVGSGEHLAALAALLAIPEAKRPEFYRFAKTRFTAWFSSETSDTDAFMAKLAADLETHRELQASLQ